MSAVGSFAFVIHDDDSFRYLPKNKRTRLTLVDGIPARVPVPLIVDMLHMTFGRSHTLFQIPIMSQYLCWG